MLYFMYQIKDLRMDLNDSKESGCSFPYSLLDLRFHSNWRVLVSDQRNLSQSKNLCKILVIFINTTAANFSELYDGICIWQDCVISLSMEQTSHILFFYFYFFFTKITLLLSDISLLISQIIQKTFVQLTCPSSALFLGDISICLVAWSHLAYVSSQAWKWNQQKIQCTATNSGR